jgi:hypothetical protein
MGRQFWINGLGTIVFGIFLLFITPYIQRWRDRRAIARGQKKTKKVKQHYADVVLYSIEPHSFTHYLIIQGMVSIIPAINMIVGMVWLGVVALTWGSPALPNIYFRIYWNAFPMLIWAFGAISLTRTTSEAIRLWQDIQIFDKYVESVPAEFRTPKVEQLAREKLMLPARNA